MQRRESTSLSGRVDPSYAGAQVVRREQAKNGTWVTRKTKRVRADGTYSFTVRPTTKRTRAYRVYLYSSTPYARVRSVTVKLNVVDPWAKASLSRTKMRKGKRVLISGRVDTFYAGERIVRQKRSASGAWKTQKTSRVRADGRFGFWVKPSTRTSHQYRVVPARDEADGRVSRAAPSPSGSADPHGRHAACDGSTAARRECGGHAP